MSTGKIKYKKKRKKKQKKKTGGGGRAGETAYLRSAERRGAYYVAAYTVTIFISRRARCSPAPGTTS